MPLRPLWKGSEKMRKRDIKKQFYLNEDEQQLLAERAGAAALTEDA